jgi:hypothetical protein
LGRVSNVPQPRPHDPPQLVWLEQLRLFTESPLIGRAS